MDSLVDLSIVCQLVLFVGRHVQGFIVQLLVNRKSTPIHSPQAGWACLHLAESESHSGPAYLYIYIYIYIDIFTLAKTALHFDLNG